MTGTITRFRKLWYNFQYLGAIFYFIRTWKLFFMNKFHLDGHLPLWKSCYVALKHTLAQQLLAFLELFIGVIKPSLGQRIARLLIMRHDGVHKNIFYGEHHRQRLDLYGCTINPNDKKPVVLFVHGGAWAYGHKWQYAAVGEFLAKKAALVAVINYRTYPIGSANHMVEDIYESAAWLYGNIEKYGGDNEKIALLGHSAGAHLGALALIRSALNAHQQSSEATQIASNHKTLHCRIKSFIGLSGPYDITDHYEFESNRIMGPIKGVHEISPMKPAMEFPSNFKTHSPTAIAIESLHSKIITTTKWVFVHGKLDVVVPTSSSKKLHDALEKAQFHSIYKEIENCTHEDMIFAFMGEHTDFREQLLQELLPFLHSTC